MLPVLLQVCVECAKKKARSQRKTRVLSPSGESRAVFRVRYLRGRTVIVLRVVVGLLGVFFQFFLSFVVWLFFVFVVLSVCLFVVA